MVYAVCKAVILAHKYVLIVGNVLQVNIKLVRYLLFAAVKLHAKFNVQPKIRVILLAVGKVILKYFIACSLAGREVNRGVVAAACGAYAHICKQHVFATGAHFKLFAAQCINHIAVIKRRVALYTVAAFVFGFKQRGRKQAVVAVAQKLFYGKLYPGIVAGTGTN